MTRRHLRLSPAETERLVAPPFEPRLAARELRARAAHGSAVTISADFARALADALDPAPRPT